MQTFIGTFQAVALLFFLGIIGFILISRKFLPRDALGHIAPLVLEVTLPSMIFVKLIRNFDPFLALNKFVLPLVWVGLTIVFFLLARIASYISKRSNSREFFISLFYQNSIFIPLILLSELYGNNSTHIVDLFLFTIFYPAFFFNTYHLFYPQKGRPFDWKKLFHPVFVIIVLAIAIKLLKADSYIPEFFLKALSMIGNMTIPLLMIVIGGTIYIDFKDKGKIEFFEVFKFILIKNIVFPAVLLGIVYFAKFDLDTSLIVVVLASVPPITALPVVIDRVGGNRHIVNQFLVASMAFSLISIPIVMLAFEKIIAN